MNKRLFLLLILLLLCSLIPLQFAAAQVTLSIEAVGSASMTTTTTDTDDITFTARVTRTGGFGLPITTVTTTSNNTSITPTVSPTIITTLLTANATADVTVTVSRSHITAAGIGTYTISVRARISAGADVTQSFTLTVQQGTQTYGVEVDVRGSATMTTTTAGTNDIAFTVRVTNSGSGQDSFTLTDSGDADANLGSTSISSLAASAYEDVTVTIPRSEIPNVDTYTITITATSDGDTTETDSDDVRVIVNIPSVYGVTLIHLGDAEVTTDINDTENIVYNLRVTNIGTDTDTIGLTKTADNDLATLSHIIITLAAEASQDVVVTFPRSVLTKSRTYRVTLTVTSQGDTSKSDEKSMTTTVIDPNNPILSLDTIMFESIGSLNQTTNATDIGDITYTLLVTNNSIFNLFDIDFTVSGDIPTATVQPASVQLFDPSMVLGSNSAQLTLTIPRNALQRAGTFFTNVTAVPYLGETKTVTFSTTVNASELVFGRVTIENVGTSSQSVTPEVKSDITYTLRVRNNGNDADNINLAITGDVPDASLDTNSVFLEEDSGTDVTLTIPIASLTEIKTYSVTVTATSQDNPAITSTATTDTVVTDEIIVPGEETDTTDTTDTMDETITTDPTNEDDPILNVKPTYSLVLSEFMFVSEGGDEGLPQWIEVYNNSNSEKNLRGWKLEWIRLQPTRLEITTIFKDDFIIPADQSRLMVTSLGRHSGGGNLDSAAVYQLHEMHAEELLQDDLENRNNLITRGGFSLRLLSPNDVLIDHLSNLKDGKKVWKLPLCLIDGIRTSVIRRFDDGVPRDGTDRSGWRRAIDSKRLVSGVYYGNTLDLGTPAFRRGKPLPVELSNFSAIFDNDKVVINWTTESELNNAGFNILRSTSQTKNFQKVNRKLIEGAGTTGERNVYQFIDKTAKPNTQYYYRLEDLDHSGTRGILGTYNLKGVVTPTGKQITTWGKLKYVE